MLEKRVLISMFFYSSRIPYTAFSDSILKNEQKYDLIQDVSETNSIYKIYLCWMKGTRYLKTGDKLVIYRTSDFQGPAKYRSVCTSVCTVSEVKTFKDFENEDLL